MTEHLIVNEICEFASLERFHDDFVRFQKNGFHRTLHVRVAADQQRQRLRLDVAHRRNHRKAVAGVRHVKISDQDIEGLCRDQFQSLGHVGNRNHGEPLVFQGRSHHLANGVVVIHKQNLGGDTGSGRIHTAQPLTN